MKNYSYGFLIKAADYFFKKGNLKMFNIFYQEIKQRQ